MTRQPTGRVRGAAGGLGRMVVAAAVLGRVVATDGLAQPADNRPPPQLDGVGIEQRLGAEVALGVTLTDATGAAVRVGDVVGGARPALLVPAYYRCPMLCPMVLESVRRGVRGTGLEPGRDFDIVVVSIDPREGPEAAAAARDALVGDEPGWYFLTGAEPAVSALAESVGFRYRYDAASDLYAHAAGLMVLTPDARVARYHLGVDVIARDLRLSLVDASAGTIGGLTDRLLLYCFHFDPTTGRYSLAVMRTLRIAGVVTVVGLGGFLALMVARERRPPRTARRAPR